MFEHPFYLEALEFRELTREEQEPFWCEHTREYRSLVGDFAIEIAIFKENRFVICIVEVNALGTTMINNVEAYLATQDELIAELAKIGYHKALQIERVRKIGNIVE